MDGAIGLVAVLAAVLPLCLPLFGYVLFLWWMDRYDREPAALLLATLAWGAIGGAAFAILFSSAAQQGLDDALGPGSLAEVAGAVLVAPLVEEATKGVVLLALLLSRHFDNATDGLVYGATAGLGFAMTENLLYGAMAYQQAGPAGLAASAVVRTFFTAMVHACATGTLGFFVGLSRHRRSAAARYLLPPTGYAGAVLIHAFWNGSMAAGSAGEGGTVVMLLAYLALPIIAAVLLAMIQISLHFEHNLLRRELEEEERLGYLPAGHAAILPYALRRLRRGWLPPGVAQAEYVRVTTRLAFRKEQARRALQPDAVRLGIEVEELRARAAALLRPVLAMG